MKVKEVINYLDSIAPPEFQENYDNCGLIVGNPENTVSGIVVCLDCTEEVIQETIDKNCNLIVAHHPIIFKGLKKINHSNYVERTVVKAIKNDINIFAIHTNLDNVIGGVNGRIADQLKLVNRRILNPSNSLLVKLVVFSPLNINEKVRQAIFDAGAGTIGAYSHCSFNSHGTGTFLAGSSANPHVGEVGKLHNEEEIKTEVVFPKHLLGKVVKAMKDAHPYEEVAYDIFPLENTFNVGSGLIGELESPIEPNVFLKNIKSSFKTPMLRHTKICKKEIKSVAVCGGVGSFLLSKAIQANADVFISSDFKYHEFFDANNQIIIADIGHFESEQYTIDLIAEGLKENFPSFAIRLTDVNTNPINYL